MTGVGIQREPKGGIESETSPSSLQAAVQGMVDEERRRDEDGGSLPANVFALRYVVAGLISRIPGKGACEREEGKEEPRLPDAKGGRDCTATFCPTKEGILSVYCWTSCDCLHETDCPVFLEPSFVQLLSSRMLGEV